MKKRSIAARRQSEQGGFALLMVFLMAAIVALMLYQQLPRVAFESEREKEQLLIDRGEQYTRAIQLYYMANNRQWPTSIDDLEKREKRFLRRRYVDPYTGKDEWRIIHTTGGFLTDSLVQKAPGSSDSQAASANTTATDGQPQVNAAVLQRPSDRPVTPLPGFGQAIPEPDPTGQQQGQPQQPGNTALPPITLQPQQGPGALPPITLQAGGNQPGGLPPITLAPPAGAGGQQVPGQPPGAFRTDNLFRSRRYRDRFPKALLVNRKTFRDSRSRPKLQINLGHKARPTPR
jgi:type II secretory pathway pseudopilin PulG